MTAQILQFPERTDRVEVDASMVIIACDACHHTNMKLLTDGWTVIAQCNQCGREQEV